MRSGDGAVSKPVGKSPFQGIRQEDWARKEKEKNVPFREQKGI
jgi:hypothetical protein